MCQTLISDMEIITKYYQKDDFITNKVDFDFPFDRDNYCRVHQVLPESFFELHFDQMLTDWRFLGFEPVVFAHLSKSWLWAWKVLPRTDLSYPHKLRAIHILRNHVFCYCNPHPPMPCEYKQKSMDKTFYLKKALVNLIFLFTFQPNQCLVLWHQNLCI